MKIYGIHQVTIPLPYWNDNVHCYLGKQPNGKWIIIDSGLNTRVTRDTWVNALKHYGISPKTDVDKILITHHHPDHFGFSKGLQDLTGSYVYINEREHELALNGLSDLERSKFYLQAGMPSALVKELQPVNNSINKFPKKIKYINKNSTYLIGELVFESLEMPGHSDKHNCFYNREKKILITGDHLTRDVIPYIAYHGTGDKNPLKTYVNTLRRMQSMDIELVLPGHGPMFKDAQERIRELLVYFDTQLNKVREIITNCTAYEVSRILYPNSDTHFEQWVSLGEVNAYLNYLVEREEVITNFKDHQTRYSLNT